MIMCSNSKELAKRTISDKVLKESVYKVAVNAKYDWYQRGLASMVNKIFDKKQDREQVWMKRLLKNYTKQWLKKLKERKCMQDLKIIFGQDI